MISGHNAMKMQLNITKLWEMLKNNPEFKQSYDSKDGTKNEFVEIELWESKEEYQTKFSTHSVKVVPAYKKEEAKADKADANIPW